MKIDFSNCTEEELWHYVAIHLKRKGIDTILVGGAVVSIYTNGLYQSGDLDFVRLDFFTEGLNEAMNEIGFIRKGRHFIHKDCKHLFVEFPGGPPVGIGKDLNITPHEVEVEGTIIKIYSPTDCVKDRLASFIHFNASECLDQAVLVAQAHPVDLSKIKKWCEKEGGLPHWERFKEKLSSN